MQDTAKKCRVIVLVKALPQPSKNHGETVCCAGVTLDKTWKRLFPIRFRHLKEGQNFRRWNIISFSYRQPTRDSRPESCHVFEDKVIIESEMPQKERAAFLDSMVIGSAEEAMERGQSLALIRPQNTRFHYKKKTPEKIKKEAEQYKQAAGQTEIFDEELAALEPTPYDLRFSFEDESGSHNYTNGDWESHAMFWRESRRRGETEALEWMDHIFNKEYPEKGMAFAIGNQAKRPQVWQLLGVIRLDEVNEPTLPL